MKKLLCFSRSYLSELLPTLDNLSGSVEYLHIVQSISERKKLEEAGHNVVLCLEDHVRDELESAKAPLWQEPADFRTLTDFAWSPYFSDRHLSELKGQMGQKVAGILQQGFEAIFAEHNIAGVISEPVALFPTHYLFYLCKKHGARSLFWANTYFPGHFFFASNVDISKTDRRTEPTTAEVDSAAAMAADYLDRVAQDVSGPVYHHKFATRKQSVRNYFEQRTGHDALIIVPGIGYKLLQIARVLRSWWAQERFPASYDYMTAAMYQEQRFYLSNLFSRKSIYDAPPGTYGVHNVFFPLQYEPEASLLYHAPDFRDQPAVVKNIAMALPDGHVLWIKEHPNQFGALGRREWQALRRKHSNIRLVYGRENGREIIKACGLAVCITSTAGLDAMIFGRKTIIMGKTFFREFPGAVPVTSTEELAQALNDPSNYGISERLEELKTSMREFGRGCYQGDPQPATSLFESGNLKNLAEAIEMEIGT